MTYTPRPHRWLWIAGLLLLVGSAAGAGWVLNHSQAGSDGNSSQAAPAAPAPQGVICFGFGDVEPGIANLYPVQVGEVVEVVAEGKAVRKGDVLLRLDSRLAQIEADRAKEDWEDAKDLLARAGPLPALHANAIEQQKQAIVIAKAKREGARQELEVKQKSYKDQVINLQVLRGAQEELKAREAEVAAEELKLEKLQKLPAPTIEVRRAERSVRAKELKYQQAKLVLEKCSLRAPDDGTVLRVLTRVGETLGAQPKMPALEFCPQGPRIIRAEVLQEWAAYVRPGQDAAIEDDTRAGVHWRGKVKHVSDWYTHRRSMLQEPFQYNDVRTLEAIVTVDAGGPPLRIGQRVRVTITPRGS